MRKLSYTLAALATLAIGVPTAASAGGFGVYVGGDRDYYGDRYYGGPSVRFYGHDRERSLRAVEVVGVGDAGGGHRQQLGAGFGDDVAGRGFRFVAELGREG